MTKSKIQNKSLPTGQAGKIKNPSIKTKILLFGILLFICHLSSVFCHSSFAQDAAKEESDLAIAQKAYDNGFYEISLGLLERFTKDYPQSPLSPQAKLLIGQCLFAKEKYLKARDIFEQLAGSNDSRAIKDAALYWAAEVHSKGKDYEGARAYYQKLVSEFPDSNYAAFAQYSLGWYFFDEEKFSDAKDAFLEFRRKFGRHKLAEDADFKLASCFYNLKEYPLARESWDSYIRAYPKSKTINEALFYRAECFYYLGELAQAEADYRRVIEGEDSGKLTESAQAGLGWVYLRQKKYPQADAAFAKASAADSNKGRAAVLLANAEARKENGDYGPALELYNKFIHDFPQDDAIYSAYFGKAENLTALFKYKDAISVYNDILTRPSDKPVGIEFIEKARYGLCALYLKTARFSKAIEEFKKLALESSNPQMRISALAQIGDIYYDLGEFLQAKAAYEKIISEYPDNNYNDYIGYRVNLALLKAGKFGEAAAGFKNLIIEYPATEFKDEIEYYTAVSYFQKHDFSRTIDELNNFIALFSEGDLRRAALYLKAVSLSYLGRYKEAQDVFRQAQKEYAQDQNFAAKCDFEIARLFYQINEPEIAEKKCLEIISRYPNSEVAPEVICFLGEYYQDRQKDDLAARYFQRLCADYPKAGFAARAAYALGEIYLREGKFDEALAQFNNILKFPQGEFKIPANLAIADIYARKGDDAAALAQYQGLLKNYKDFSREVYFKIADAYKQMNRYEDAFSVYKEALDKSSAAEKNEIRFALAEAYEEKGGIEQAITEYENVIAFSSADKYWLVKGYLRLARIYEDRENWPAAKNVYDKIAGMDTDEAKFAQERLEAIKAILK